MDIIIIILLGINTCVLLALAGSVAKLLRLLTGETSNSKEAWGDVIRERQRLDSLQRLPNYAETQFAVEERLPNWDGIPRGTGKNWDGLPLIEG